MKRSPSQDTPRVIAVAAIFFGSFAALGWMEGVFARLPAETLAALGFFALAFAAGTYALDRDIRGWVDARLRVRKGEPKSPAGKQAAT